MNAHPLKVERELRGWSQAKVAEAVGTNVRTVIRWEQGQSVPYPYYREQLCSLFSKNARELGLLVQDDQASHEQEEQKKSKDVQLITSAPLGTLLDPAIPVAPGGTSSLVGRESLLAQVKQLLWESDSLNLIALQGLPGIGKTALVVALAADPTVRDRFTGGILWAGLGQKPDVLGHLARWGKLLGVLPTTVADVTSQESWGQVLRAAIGRRRFLLVIDDAWGVEEALAFQVGGERCAHLLTSRLPHVAFAFAGERALVVPELQETDALALLARYVPGVIKQDHKSAQALVQVD
jgi:transcriptional regulator with XRE-family HTH domain